MEIRIITEGGVFYQKLCEVENSGLIEELYRAGKYHSPTNDIPAITRYFSCGTLSSREWLKDDVYHRDGDKPAYIEYSKDGTISTQYWYKNGKRHRDGDKPAVIESDGTMVWYKNGKSYKHNDG